MELNKKEGYKIQSIICTNNENNICHHVTYPRISKAIKGYHHLIDKKFIEGLGGSFKYYKTDFVGSNNIQNVNDEDRYQLALKAGYLLAITENTLDQLILSDTSYPFQFFENSNKITAIYFEYNMLDLKKFKELLKNIKKPKVIYIFSWGNGDEFKNDFNDLKNAVVKPIPEPILRIYHSIYHYQEKG